MDVTPPLNFKMPLIFIFGVFILIHCKECASTKTVVLIYDKADITAYDIEWLTRHVVQLSTACLNKSLDVEFVLKFPDESNIGKTSNCITSRNNYSIEGQSTLKTLLKHIKESPSYSAIYVITNVTTLSDETSVDEILEAIQIKRTEVNFLVAAISSGYELETYSRMEDEARSAEKYELISSASNGCVMDPYTLTSESAKPLTKYDGFDGLIFYYEKFADLTQMIHRRLASVPILVWYQQVVHKDNKTYCTQGPGESFLKNEAFRPNAWFVLTGRELKININGGSTIIEWKMEMTPATYTTEMCDVIKERYGQRERPDHTLPSRNYFSVGPGLHTEKDRFDFYYGFASEKVRSLNETYKRPIKGTSNKIYVTPCHKNADYGFNYFNILFLNAPQYGEKIALERVEETDLYVGSFYPPNEEYFFIQAVIQREDKTISRRSSTALSAAEGFGEDYGNPLCEEPIFRNLPVSELRESQDCIIITSYCFDYLLTGIMGYIIVRYLINKYI